MLSISEVASLSYWHETIKRAKEDKALADFIEQQLKKCAREIHDLVARPSYNPYYRMGRFRLPFFREREAVIKVPASIGGIIHNLAEVLPEMKERLDPSIKTASAVFHEITYKYGIPVVEMEFVDEVCPEPVVEEDLSWTLMIDAEQVGVTADGRLLAYDFAEVALDEEDMHLCYDRFNKRHEFALYWNPIQGY